MYFLNCIFSLIACSHNKSLSAIPRCRTCRCCVRKPMLFSCTTRLQQPSRALPAHPRRPGCRQALVIPGVGSQLPDYCGEFLVAHPLHLLLKSVTPTDNPCYLLWREQYHRGVVCLRAGIAWQTSDKGEIKLNTLPGSSVVTSHCLL